MTQEEIEQMSTMNDVPEDLQVLVELAISEGRRELENHSVCAMFQMRLPDGTMKRIRLEETGGLSSRAAKRILFDSLRMVVKAAEASAVLMVTDAWIGLPTPKLRENKKEFERVTKDLSMDELVARGLIRRVEALVATVQTPERYVIVHQVYERDQTVIRWGERRVMAGPQFAFDGAGKMFGGGG